MAAKSTSKEPVGTLDPNLLEALKAETADLLGRAPEDMFTRDDADAAAATAAGRYVPPSGKGEGDPEDISLLLQQAFKAIHRPVPVELLDAYRASKEPLLDGAPTSSEPAPETMSLEEYRKHQAKIRDKFRQAQASVGSKRDGMLAAIRNSPRVSYHNREDRWLQINNVKVTVPEGVVTIPAIIARVIEDMDRQAAWAEREKLRAQQFLNVERPTSFVKKKVAGFAIY